MHLVKGLVKDLVESIQDTVDSNALNKPVAHSELNLSHSLAACRTLVWLSWTIREPITNYEIKRYVNYLRTKGGVADAVTD